MSNKSIKQTYSDVLFWVTSPMSKGKRYHITYAQESVLRKLIHYTDKGVKRFINYSNESISSHIYMSEEHLKKILPKLNKVGFISISNKKHYKDGEFKTSRSIEINWSFIEGIAPDLPKVKPNKEIVEVTIDSIEVETQDELEEYQNSFRLQDEIDLYKVLPKIGFSCEETSYIIEALNDSIPIFMDFIRCIKELMKESNYKDYTGPIITPEIKSKLAYIQYKPR
jgi:hypothetical protein